MGQEQSNSKESSSLLSITKGFGSKSAKPGLSQVVVVKASQDEKFDINQDEDVKRLQNIPIFYPILRNSLGLPGIKDPLDVTTKIDHRPVLCVFQKLQDHLASSSEIICGEQTSLGTRVREFDYAVSALLNSVSDRQRQLLRLQSELNKINEINSLLTKITANLQEIVPMAKAINQMLPEQDRLPSFDLGGHAQNYSVNSMGLVQGNGSHRSSADDLVEHKVVDKETIDNR